MSCGAAAALHLAEVSECRASEQHPHNLLPLVSSAPACLLLPSAPSASCCPFVLAINAPVLLLLLLLQWSACQAGQECS